MYGYVDIVAKFGNQKSRTMCTRFYTTPPNLVTIPTREHICLLKYYYVQSALEDYEGVLFKLGYGNCYSAGVWLVILLVLGHSRWALAVVF